ncbi:MAG: hypothetical protein HOK65_08580, partial [Crocinitomicaceae bacterium]|nr:hypothetical protein [Crocinitomicaceae bacterium]
MAFLVLLASCAVADQGELNISRSYRCDAESTLLQKGEKVFTCNGDNFSGGKFQSKNQARSGKHSCKLLNKNSIGMTI